MSGRPMSASNRKKWQSKWKWNEELLRQRYLEALAQQQQMEDYQQLKKKKRKSLKRSAKKKKPKQRLTDEEWMYLMMQ